ncbi:SDR family oxidoreductase [Indioceanicola profundi]|uniref:SDR family oxidoreductase n=1 Tax=Indioceanicola profundi TaxID=2220096 RepID=UPI000E6ADC2E|nr:SDR family oxidoreductase [Indioceanicola profundi]
MLTGPDVLLVTGGSRGIGAAIVRKAARDGYAVGFSYVRNGDAAARLVAELDQAGHRAHAVQGDVADPDFAARFFDAAEAALGPATALVNNAGITGRIGRFRDADPAMLRSTLDTNVLGTMYAAQEAIRRWEAAGIPGRMVNISSIASTLGAPGEYVHYAATKAAVEAFTIGLAKEVAPAGIRVAAVAPGTAYTDIHEAAGEPNRPARVVSRVPMGRIAEPEEIANAVLWLLSAEASYVTGAVLRVSGGL